jgi:hypothetical protein
MALIPRNEPSPEELARRVSVKKEAPKKETPKKTAKKSESK